jgi:hypothetical protein
VNPYERGRLFGLEEQLKVRLQLGYSYRSTEEVVVIVC